MQETTIKAALRAWVVTASGLGEQAVIWAQQPAVRLPLPFITMRLGDLLPLGSADEVQYAADLSHVGQEMTETVVGRRELSLSIQCFGENTDSSRQILSRVHASLGLTSVSDALHDAEVSVFDRGPVQNVTAPRETLFEPRSLLEVRCYVGESVSEKNTYIQTVEITNQLTNTVFTVTS